MKTKLTAVLLTLVIISALFLPAATLAATGQPQTFRVTYAEEHNDHLAEYARYAEFRVLAELVKTLDFSVSMGQAVSFANSLTVPTEITYAKYAAGGTGSLSMSGNAKADNLGWPVLSGELLFTGEVVEADGNSTLYAKKESSVETRAAVSLALGLTPGELAAGYGIKPLYVGGHSARAVTSAKRTLYYRDGRVSTQDGEGSVFGAGFIVYVKVSASSTSGATTPVVDDEEPGMVFTGRIFDYADRPLKHLQLTIRVGDSDYKGVTDENGRYLVPADDLEEVPASYMVTTRFTYHMDGVDYFSLLVPMTTQYYFPAVTLKVNVKSQADLDLEYRLSNVHPPSLLGSLVNLRRLDDLAAVYHYMSQAVEYYRDELGIYDQYDVPKVMVRCYDDRGGSTNFSPTMGIMIASADMSRSSPMAPHNREWHEFNHFVMYSLYGKWPESELGEYSENHGGFANDSTADSYVEGFAEFMALVIGDYYELGNGSVYAPIADMSLYYKPWQYLGQAEELAVAAVLWKLYSGVYSAEIGSSIDDLWPLLSTYSRDFGEVFERLLNLFPDKAGTIEALFVSHGFFRVSQPGNGKRDPAEAFKDANGSGRFDAGETFFDLPTDESGRIIARFMVGDDVGYAADLGRFARRSPLNLPGHLVKVTNHVPVYSVTYTFNEDSAMDFSVLTPNKDGLITVVVPPDEYQTSILVEPYGVAASTPLTFSSQQFYASYEESIERGYYVEHDFGISASATPVVSKEEIFSTENVPYPLLTESGQLIEAPAAAAADPKPIPPEPEPAPEEEPQKSTRTVLMVLPVLALVGIVALLFARSRR